MSTDATLKSIEIPAHTGRNDPCPCGSGKKYKKCHMRLNKALSDSSASSPPITDRITAETSPYDAYVVLRDAHADNLSSLFFDAAHPQGPWRAQFKDRETFLLAASSGTLTLPAAASFEIMRLRVDLPDVYVLLAHGAEDPRQDHVFYQILTLRPNELDAAGARRAGEPPEGWRLFEVRNERVAKSALPEQDGADVSLDLFEIGWKPRSWRDLPTHVRLTEEQEEALALKARADEEE